MAALYLRESDEAKAVPKETFVSWQALLSRAYRHWWEAKEQNDYGILAPDLQAVIDGARSMARLRAGEPLPWPIIRTTFGTTKGIVPSSCWSAAISAYHLSKNCRTS